MKGKERDGSRKKGKAAKKGPSFAEEKSRASTEMTKAQQRYMKNKRVSFNGDGNVQQQPEQQQSQPFVQTVARQLSQPDSPSVRSESPNFQPAAQQQPTSPPRAREKRSPSVAAQSQQPRNIPKVNSKLQKNAGQEKNTTPQRQRNGMVGSKVGPAPVFASEQEALTHQRPQYANIEINSISELEMTPNQKTENIEIASRGAPGPFVAFKQISNQVAPTNAVASTINGDAATLISQQQSYGEDQYSEEATCKNLWIQKQDKNQVYDLQKSFKMSEHRDEQVLQLTRWRDKDVKGNRKRYYLKEVQSQNANIMTITKQSRLELAQNMTDGHKCLNFRKKFKKVRIYVSEGANYLTSSRYFEGFIIVVIGLNCITLAQSDSTREETQVEKSIDLTFNIIYTVEMSLRIFSLGFIWGKESYLRSLWNQLDFICVVTAYMEMVGGGASLSGLRAFRVLRPLRFVNNIEGLRVIVSSVMAAIPELQDTIIVLFFFFLIFAIGGLNLFMGMLKQRCVGISDGITLLDGEGEEIICGSYPCPEGYYCGKKTLNPNYDVTNFDNIFWALLNVFQCITLEGWSDIMVMYQKAFTPWTFFFFMPMVFIGAFFLLNLTLAVIQSSFQVTKNKKKAELLRKKKEAEEMTSGAAKKKDDGDDDDYDQGAGKKAKNIGVAQFFVAKRAAAKMKKYWQNYKRQKKIDDDNRAIREREEKQAAIDAEKADVLRRQSTMMRQKQHRASRLHTQKSLKLDNNSQQSAIKSLSESYKEIKENGSAQDGYDNEEWQRLEKTVMKDIINVDQLDDIRMSNDTIKEMSSSSEELQEVPEDVLEFLKEVGPDPVPTHMQRQKSPDRNRTAQNFNKPVMAFNAMQSRTLLSFKTQDRIPLADPQRDNFTKPGENTQLTDEKADYQETNNGKAEGQKWILDDIGFDKIDKLLLPRQEEEERLQESERKSIPLQIHQINTGEVITNPQKDQVEVLDVDHPLDLSFTHDKNYGKRPGSAGGYASDNNKIAKRQQMAEQIDDNVDFMSSIISSDDSINQQIRKFKKKDDREDLNQTGQKYGKQRFTKQGSNNKLLKRMLTTDFANGGNRGLNRGDKMNDSQSTFLANNPSFKQQIDCYSNLLVDKQETGNSMKKGGFRRSQDLNVQSTNNLDFKKQATTNQGTMITATDPRATVQSAMSKTINKKNDDKKAKVDIYRTIDDEFKKERPTNPLEFIEKDQKVTINPGVPYYSTSQVEIFEIRTRLNFKNQAAKRNEFIASPQEDVDKGIYEGEEEAAYIKPLYEAYQLKFIHQHSQKDEADWDSDDEDALILSQQPYETVMQTGFKDYLNHLNTKFLARRSDILVSSTISITLTPQDDGFEPTHFAKIQPEEIWEYVMLRNEYRQFFVHSNKLPQKQRAVHNINNGTESSCLTISQMGLRYDSEFENSENEDMFQEEQSQMVKLGLLGPKQPKEKLPRTLLSEPLDAKRRDNLSKKELKMYKFQKQKYEQQVKINVKKPLHPRNQEFDLINARLLIKGEYHKDEDDDGIEIENKLEEGDDRVDLNRAMLAGKNDPKHELNLDNFDEQLDKVIWGNMGGGGLMQDPRAKGDHVPIEIKEQLQLPKDMSDKDINFDKVRELDTKYKKRTPEWSGQAVLDIGLNISKSKWVLKKMNKLRVWPKGIYNFIKKVRCILKSFVRFSLFENFLTVCVLINTVVMAMDSYDIDAQTAKDLEDMNLVFTWIFIVEMGLKLLARGPKKYASEKMNLLDGGVVLLSIVEMIMQAVGGGSGAGSLQAFRTVRVFRTFRVLRVTRILRALKSMAMVIGVMQRSIQDFILIIILMFVFIFIYTLLGRQIFQGQYTFGPDEELPRANYETFSVAFMTVFQVLTMENWQQVLYASMRASQNSMIFKTVAAIYYISWIFIGNFILLNLFLAILIDAFAEEDAQDEQTDEQLEQEAANLIEKRKRLNEEKEKRMKKLGTSSAQLSKMKMQVGNNAGQSVKKKKQKARANFTGQKNLRESDLADLEDMETHEVRRMLVENGILKAQKSDNIDPKNVGPEIHAEKSIYLFGRNTIFRRNVHFVQKHKYFDNFIMLLIALSSIKLAMESYLVNLPEDDPIVKAGVEADFVINILFIMECVLKIIALGFAMDEGSYLRDSWNRLDFFIVSCSIIDMMLTGTDIPALKVLRMLRMIRPLRVISHNPQLKMIVAALFQSVGSIINVMVIVMIIWLMFAIYGMNTFMGMFFRCSIDPYKNNTQWICEDKGGSWDKFDSNFDDIGQSMMTLFIVASLEGWPDIMYQAIDVTKKDNGPKMLASPGQAGFFIVFILIGAFFFLNFFIGVLFLKYEQARKEETKGQTYEQLYWQELQVMIINAKPPHKLRYKPPRLGFPGHSPPRSKMYEFIESDAFTIGIMVCIVLNMFQMALDHEGASVAFIEFLKVTNYFFSAVFLVEAILKLYVYRWAYFYTGWNKFDFFVVASSLVDLGLEVIMPKPEGGQEDSGNAILSVGPQLGRVLRVLRVTRVLRLAGKYQGLQSLLKTIMMSVDSLFNVLLLLMLIFFIMAVLGNVLFLDVFEGNVISDYKNFQNFHQSFSLLFSISTGEDWNRLMYDCLHTPPHCEEGVNCVSSKIGFVFFICFNVLVGQIMLNLFILVIIQQFQKYKLEKDNPLERFEADFLSFQIAWESFSQNYMCMKIKPKYVAEFIKKLPGKMQRSMGMDEYSKEEDINRMILKMGINVDEGFIYFHEMLYRIMRAQFVTAKRLKFSKIMTVKELATQYQITDLTLKMKNHGQKQKLTKQMKEKAFFVQRSSQPVNLFLTKMFYKTSFKTWHVWMRAELKRKMFEQKQKQEQERAKSLGKEYTPKKFVPAEVLRQEVEIEREHEFAITCSSEEEDKDDLKSKRSLYSGKDASARAPSAKRGGDSPQLFRSKARHRMFGSSQKFSVVLNEMSDQPSTSPRKTFKNSMLIVHTEEEAKATAEKIFIDPNSMEYQNAVLEQKMNKAQSNFQKMLKDPSVQTLSPDKSQSYGISLRGNVYSGIFARDNPEVFKKGDVPFRLNAPLKTQSTLKKEKKTSPRSPRDD